jgi:putative oxidoreductase
MTRSFHDENGKVTELNRRLDAWAPIFLSILRVMAALLYLSHGTSKLLGFPSLGSSPPLFSLFGLAGTIELVGGVLLVIGLFTRPVAFIVSGELAFAYFIGHAPHDFFPIINHGEPAILLCFIFLYLVFAGPGAWSVDGIRAQPSATAARA